MFFQRLDDGYHIIHYNPNKNKRFLTAETFYNNLNAKSVRGYNDIKNNPHGRCTYLSWMEIYFAFTTTERNPFKFQDDRLKKYNTTKRKFVV